MNPATKPTAAGTTKKCSAVDFVFLSLGVFVAALCGLTALSHAHVLTSKTFWALLLAAITLLAAPFLFRPRFKQNLLLLLFSLLVIELLLEGLGWAGLLPGVNTRERVPWGRVYWTSEGHGNSIRNRYGYTDGVYYYDIGNQPYLAYAYSYDVEGTNKRTTAYAQDQWTIGRFTANVGLRYDGIKGEGSDGVEYYNSNMFSPRLGAALDVTGRGNSVLKAYYGHLYDGAVFSTWNRAVSGIGDFVIYDVAANNALTEIDRISGASKYQMADDIKHPRTDEFNLSYEQQLWGNWRATATYIRRSATNFVNSTLIGGTWNPVAFTNPKTNQAMTIYGWANRASIPQQFRIDNLETVTYPGAGSVDASRDYNAAMFVLNRRLSNRWQAQASYVYSKTAGTVTSASQAAFSSSLFENPNTSLLNRDGRVPLDRPHEVKVFAGYQVPVIEVAVNASFRGTSGTTYTPFNRVASGRVNWTSSVDVQLEPQGSYRNDAIRILDLRVEKVFAVDVHRFGVYVDVENATNSGIVTTRNARFPSVGIRGNTVLFGSATAVAPARQITIGARWSF